MHLLLPGTWNIKGTKIVKINNLEYVEISMKKYKQKLVGLEYLYDMTWMKTLWKDKYLVMVVDFQFMEPEIKVGLGHILRLIHKFSCLKTLKKC